MNHFWKIFAVVYFITGCATIPYRNNYIDPVLGKIEKESAQYKTHINSQLLSRAISKDRATFLLSRHEQFVQARRLKRQIEINDPEMAAYLETEYSYVSKMEKALKKGEISQIEFDEKFQVAKFRIAQFAQQRRALRASQEQAQIDADNQRQNMLLNYWQNTQRRSYRTRSDGLGGYITESE